MYWVQSALSSSQRAYEDYRQYFSLVGEKEMFTKAFAEIGVDPFVEGFWIFFGYWPFYVAGYAVNNGSGWQAM